MRVATYHSIYCFTKNDIFDATTSPLDEEKKTV